LSERFVIFILLCGG